jgi:hypothetical protein
MPAITERCLFTECDERCTEACSLGVIRFEPEEKWPKLMANPHWVPVPVLPNSDGE